ncbi:MAG: hypothetical protein RL545_721, partial [Actinomycetota bacterium]
MALTADLKYELSRLKPNKSEVRLAELSVILRFTASVHVVNATMILEAEFDSAQLANRVKGELKDLFGIDAKVDILHASGVRKSSKHILRVLKQTDLLIRQTGLYYPTGKPVRGIHSRFISDSAEVAAVVWRGALMSHGSLTDPGRSSSLEVSCPSNEAASSLVGLAKRLGINGAKSREVRGVHRVVVREGDEISQLLGLIGATNIKEKWDSLRAKREVRSTASRLANFDDANLRRSAQAAVAAGGFYLLAGVFGGTIGMLFSALPVTLIHTIAGLALLGTIAGSLQRALQDDKQRDAAVITFLITASGLTLLNVGAAFW